MKHFIVILLMTLIIGCESSEGLSSKKKSLAHSSNSTKEYLDNKELQEEMTPLEVLNESSGGTSDIKFSAQSTLDSLLNSDDTRDLVYLIHPDADIIVYCYQALESECNIKGLYKDQYFEYDITQVEKGNKGKITLNAVKSVKTYPSEWLALNDDYVQVNMVTQIMFNSQRYTSNERLIIFFDEQGVFWR